MRSSEQYFFPAQFYFAFSTSQIIFLFSTFFPSPPPPPPQFPAPPPPPPQFFHPPPLLERHKISVLHDLLDVQLTIQKPNILLRSLFIIILRNALTIRVYALNK